MSRKDSHAREAVTAAREAREEAERTLRASRHARNTAARALEHDIHPMTIDEDERARRRLAVYEADALVAIHVETVRRARVIEDAAIALVAAVTGTSRSEKAIASSIVDILGGRVPVPALSRSLVELESVRLASRAVRRPGTRPQRA